MMPSAYGELVNLDNLHYAKVLIDNEDNYQTGENKYLAPAAEMKKEATVEVAPRYYDGKPMFTSVTEAATNVTLTISGVPSKLAAELTGKPYDAAHGLMIDTGDASGTPDYALSARAGLGDGGYRFYQFLKGKFSIGAETAHTKEDKVTANTVDLTYTGVVTVHEFTLSDGSVKGVKGVQADTTDAAFAGVDTWFAQVQTPETLGAPAVLALVSSVPDDDATGISVGSDITLTFSNVIDSAVTSLISSDLTAVPVTVLKDATGKVIMVHPENPLTAASTYSLVVGEIKDVYGQKLTGTVITFTTA